MHARVSISHILLCLIIGVSINEAYSGKFEPLSKELVDYLNSKPGMTWKATVYPRFKTGADVSRLLGTKQEPTNLKLSRRPTVSHANSNLPIPESFDAREAWPHCQTIKKITDQSSCGSCWAVGAVAAMSDRLCTVLNEGAYYNVQLSARDLLSCCYSCGYGCLGGWVGPAWDFWRDEGIVTGAWYDSNGTCLPYPFAPCGYHKGHEYEPCPEGLYTTPKCVNKCDKDYGDYAKDKHRAVLSYNVESTVESIQREIWINGPVEAAFNVYDDFGMYGHGIYQHTYGLIRGGHAVRIIGWGTENGTDYWLVANSWNVDWGEKGFFRILRGKNHCGIESSVVAGIPAKPIT